MPGSLITKNVWPDTRVLNCLNALLDRTLTDGGLAIGSDKTKVQNANTVTFVNDGVFGAKTTAEYAFTATDHDIPAHPTLVQERVYLYSVTGTTVTVTAGEIASGAGNAVVPQTPAGTVPFGYLRLAVAAGSTPFDATTDELDEAHLTDTYVDLSVNVRDFLA